MACSDSDKENECCPRGSTRYLFSVVVHLLDIDLALLCFAKQMLAEEVGHLPEEVLVLGLKTVAVAGEEEHLEALVGADEGIDDACGVCRVHIVVHITCYQQQVSLETPGKLLVGADVV